MSIGARIKQLRKERKLTQTDLTEGFLTKGILSLIENDKSAPSMETLEHIAGKLGVSVSYLTQQGDESWTRDMADYFQKFKGDFPFEEIRKRIEPYVDRIFPNEDGVQLLEILRSYYRFNQDNVKADDLHDVIYKRLSELGLRHLAVRELLNHAVSKMFAFEYKDALETLEHHKENILDFSKYDSKIEIQYYYIASILSSAVEDHTQFIDYSNKVETLSFKQLYFAEYYHTIRFLIFYYTFIEDNGKKMEYADKLRQYLNFVPTENSKIEFMDEDEFYYKYYLIESPEILEQRLLNYQKRLASIELDNENNEWLRKTKKQTDLELYYVKGRYQDVLDNFDLSLYEFKQAAHPIDRITRQVKSLVYALSLYRLGNVNKAKQEIKRVEASLGQLKDSLYAEEYRRIKAIIEENNAADM